MSINKNRSQSPITVRAAIAADGAALCDLLNEIIKAGGTTALETVLSVDELLEHYVTGPDCLSCFVASGLNQELPVAFQLLVRSPELSQDWGDIGTFARRDARGAGVGSALFNYTKAAARDGGISTINATIRGDNLGGLKYYEKMGFVTYKTARAVPLQNGTLIDRVYKKYTLA